MKSFLAIISALAVAITVPAAAKQDPSAPLAVMHGVYHSAVFNSKGFLTGYATIVLDAGKLVHFQGFDRYAAPYDVQREVESSSAYEIPHTTLVYEDSVNAYYYTTFPNGTWAYYSVNKQTGQTTVISSGRLNADPPPGS